MLFFIAGLKAVSSAQCFMAHELAVNPDIQEKLHREISDVSNRLNGSKLTYEVLQKMSYLDCVVSETLRRWTALATNDRFVTKPYLLEDKNGNKIQLNVGDGVLFPTGAIHMDPEYYPSPEIFDPERFSDENKQKIRPDTFLPFGIGPRSCVKQNSSVSIHFLFHLTRNFCLSDCIAVRFDGNKVYVLLSGEKFCH